MRARDEDSDLTNFFSAVKRVEAEEERDRSTLAGMADRMEDEEVWRADG